MKKRIFTTAALVCCMLAVFAFAAGLAGKWTGTLKTPDGNEIALTYNFKTDSGKITGTAASPEGEVPIQNSKMISATDFTFTVPVNGEDIKHTGKFYPDADSIGMDIEAQGAKMHMTLKSSTDK